MSLPLQAATLAEAKEPGDFLELLPLERLLQRAEGFALAFVKCNMPAERERIVHFLDQRLQALERVGRTLAFGGPVDDLWQEIERLSPAAAAQEVLLVLGFEKLIPFGRPHPPALSRLNLARERFRELPCPIVLLLPDHALTQLAREAPDFWAWRSAVVEVEVEPEVVTRALQAKPEPLWFPFESSESLERHLDVLRELLGEFQAREDSKSEGEIRQQIAWDQVRIGDIRQRQGDLDEALRLWQEEALPVFERLDDVRSRAVTMGRIADVFQARGDLDEALRIRREEELPVYDRLGDLRERAVTIGKIADVLEARGDQEEALRIHREELVPVFERLGDVRARAVTMSRIADVHQARGDLEEALRIRREEEMPVYERLGDVRARAMTMGKIADVLQARGDLEEALRLRREEELPVYERLGVARDLLVGRAELALTHLARGQDGDRETATSLLHLALRAAAAMRIPEAGTIRSFLVREGLPLPDGE